MIVSVALAAAAIAYTVHTLTFVTSSLRLLPQQERYVVLLKEYQRDFGELNDIVVVVEAPNPDVSKAYAAKLVEALGQAGVSASRITYHIDRNYFDVGVAVGKQARLHLERVPEIRFVPLRIDKHFATTRK